MNEAAVKQALDQAVRAAHVTDESGEVGGSSSSQHWTVAVPFPEWERLVLAISPVVVQQPGEQR